MELIGRQSLVVSQGLKVRRNLDFRFLCFFLLDPALNLRMLVQNEGFCIQVGRARGPFF